MIPFKVKVIAIPKGKSKKTGNVKDVSMFFIGRELTVINETEHKGCIYYGFEEEDTWGTSLLGDSYNSKYFEKLNN